MSGDQLTRKKVRENLVSLLKGFTDVNDSVFRWRVVSMFEEEIPSINIYTGDDVPITTKKYQTEFQRTLQIFIEILVKQTGREHHPEDDADVIAGQVEDRILPNFYLQYPPPKNLQDGDEGDAGEPIVESIELLQIVEAKVPDGLVDVFALAMEFTATYRYEKKTGAAVPFVTGDVRYNLEGQQAEDDQAHDNFTLPQPT